MKTIKLLIVDEKMRTTEIEINPFQFQSLGIDLTNVKEHDKKRDLNITITDYLDSFKI